MLRATRAASVQLSLNVMQLRSVGKVLLVLSLLVLSASVALSQKVTKSMLRWPDTGQSTDYTSVFGEDSDYSINPPGYIVHSDGTVVDTVTGLMWQRDDGGEMTVENAQHYVDTLRLASYSNWRLPTLLESLTLLQLDKLNPAMDATIFHSVAAEYWWTSERQFNDTSKVWVTNAGGGTGPHPKSETISAGGAKHFHVRAVRDTAEAVSVDHWVDVGNGTIVDQLTGLIWQKVLSTDSMSWEQALSYAENLNLATHTDWRLPNVKELCTIVDRGRSAPAIASSLFQNALSSRYWSSTAQYKQSANAWFVDMKSFGLSSYDPKSTRHPVICVRGGITNTTGVKQESSRFSISPIPADDFAHIYMDEQSELMQTMQVYDQLGTLVWQGQCNQILHTSELKSGIYFLRLVGEKTCFVQCLRVVH